MRGKVTESDSHLLSCVYAPAGVVDGDELANWGHRLGQGFVDWCDATSFEARVVHSAAS